MNQGQFKNLFSHMCLAGAAAVHWSLTQDMAGSSSFAGMTNILSLSSANLGKTFRENSIMLVNVK